MVSYILVKKVASTGSNITPIIYFAFFSTVRISESLAKMELQPFAVDRHVEESLRLFHVSTMDAALSGSLSGVEGFTTQDGK